jgi:hypothetical protein
MPADWKPEHKKSAYPNMYYPTKEDILKFGTPVTLEEIRRKCGLKSIAEVSKAVHTYYTGSAGRSIYQCPDLVKRIDDSIDATIFYPIIDEFSCLIMNDILKVLGSKGATRMKYSTLFDDQGSFEIIDIQAKDIITFCGGPATTITDENEDFVFTIFFEDLSCLFYTRENIRESLSGTNLEGIIADEKTTLIWEDDSYFLI